MAIQIKGIVDTDGVTQEVYVLRGIRHDLLLQVQEPCTVKLFSIYTRLGVVEQSLSIDSEVRL